MNTPLTFFYSLQGFFAKPKTLMLMTLLGVGMLLTNGKYAQAVAPSLQSPPPAGVAGKWMYGTFSPTSFWSTTGKYNGAASEQAMAYNFSPNGTYELYVINSATYYNCRTSSYSYFKGKAKFNEADRSITLTPTSGTQRGEYGCYPSKNFKRDASASELSNGHKTLYYARETDAKGQPALRLYFSSTDKQGAQLTKGNW